MGAEGPATGTATSLEAWTVGHSTRSAEEFLTLLRGYGIRSLVDIRTIPRSRHNPQFNRTTLPDLLAAAEILYHHEPRLGGLRRPLPDSPNSAWRNAAFRGFADHMATPIFRQGIDALLVGLARHRTAVMCAEAVPWRCHRSLVADALTVRGVRVVDILDLDHARVHALTPTARWDGEVLRYPGSPQGRLPIDEFVEAASAGPTSPGAGAATAVAQDAPRGRRPRRAEPRDAPE